LTPVDRADNAPMTSKSPARSHRHIIAAILSLFFCGLGQIYLHRISRGLILILSFSCAIAIIWIVISDREFHIANWDGKQLIFSPSRRSISLGGQTFHVADIMKVTGTIQLVFTWAFSIADAWREGRKSIGNG
jgi:TM2 domain-containing membrane protein YozV